MTEKALHKLFMKKNQKINMFISFISGYNYMGDVLVNGRPICDDFWDNRDAKTVCRMLGFSEQTKATSFSSSSFGNRQSNFIMDDVECGDNNHDLRTCSHKTYNNCNAGESAGVQCIDNKKLALKGGSGREGNVYIGNVK